MTHHDPHHETPTMHDDPDAWHAHGAGEPAPQQAHAETVNAPRVIGIGLSLFVVVLLTIVVIHQYYLWYTNDLIERRESPGEAVSIELDARTRKLQALRTLDGPQYGWVDHDTVQGGIEESMQAVISEYAEGRR